MCSYSTNPSQIRAMFARIAKRYDLNNRIHALGLDQAWRHRAVREARIHGGEAVLDAACGTGDLTILFRRAGAGRVVGLDFCPEMLDIARKKFPASEIEWMAGDAMALPFEAGQFDVASTALGLRNMADPVAALREFFRVLRRRGRLVVLEFRRPSGVFPGALLRFYLDHVLPWTAGAIAADRAGAYHYLCESMKSFMTPEQLAQAISRCGFSGVGSRLLTPGVAAIHIGTHP